MNIIHQSIKYNKPYILINLEKSVVEPNNSLLPIHINKKLLSLNILSEYMTYANVSRNVRAHVRNCIDFDIRSTVSARISYLINNKYN